jgi:hypothetical protein
MGRTLYDHSIIRFTQFVVRALALALEARFLALEIAR